jgi:hypothetical protein
MPSYLVAISRSKHSLVQFPAWNRADGRFRGLGLGHSVVVWFTLRSSICCSEASHASLKALIYLGVLSWGSKPVWTIHIFIEEQKTAL